MTNDQKPMTNETALREALEPFAAMAEHFSNRPDDVIRDGAYCGGSPGILAQVTIGDYRRAALALQSPSQPVAAGTVNFPAHADDCEAMLRPRADCTCVPTLAHPQASPPPAQSEVTLENIAFLEEAARYFERRPTEGEDMAHWANVYNAKNCRDIAAKLTRLAHSLPDTQDHVAEAGKMVTSLTSELATVKKRLESAGDRIADAVAESIALEFKGFWDADDLVNEIPTMIRDAASRLLQEQEKQNG